MTLPSKSTEPSSLSNGFSSGDPRGDLWPDGFDPENVLYGRNDERSPMTPNGDDVLHTQLQSSEPVLKHPEEVKTCKVCGDTATGMYFGALVCVPCKTFYLRYAGEGFAYECKSDKSCEVTMATRTQCKFCRYHKCLQVGMCRRVRPVQVEAQDGQQLCVVCQDVANGVHFGVLTCEGCKKFFRRGLTEQKSYRCRGGQNCSINPSNRNSCRFCRFQKCIQVGMSREAIQMGRPSKTSVFEGGHQRSHGKDTDKSPSQGMLLPVPLQGQSVVPRTSATGLDGGLGYPGLPCNPSSRTPMGSRANPANGMFFPPSWAKNPLSIPIHAVDGLRQPWSQRYDHSSAEKSDWSMVGVLLPSVEKDSPTGSDEGDRSDCPDSTMVRGDESDLLLPSDYTTIQRTLPPSSEWNGDENYLPDWTEKTPDSNIRLDPVHRLLMKLKQEVASSDDDGSPVWNSKRIRYDRGPRDHSLPQDRFDVQLKYSPSEERLGTSSSSSQAPRPSLGHRNGNVSSSDYLTGTGSCVDALKSFQLQRNSYSAMDVDVRIPDSLTSETSAILVQPVMTGSAIVSSSSSSHPLDGQIGSTTRPSFIDHESESTRHLTEFLGDRDETGARTCSVHDHDSRYSLDDELETQAEEVGNQCWRTIQQVIPAYHRFVSAGTTINLQLKEDHETWKRENPRSDSADEISLWIQTTVVPAYTTASVAYCKCLPDFTELCAVDQRILIAGGQSQSRILAAALHWYDAGEKRFRNFLSWRAEGPRRVDAFKGKLRAFAGRVSGLHLDPIEAALLNAVGMFDSDYPNLQDRGAIEVIREKILTTMKSYIAVNNGAPGARLESLWQVLKEARVLGAEHVALTNTRTLGLPSDGVATNGAMSDNTEATVGQPLTAEKKSHNCCQTTNNGRRSTRQLVSRRHVT